MDALEAIATGPLKGIGFYVHLCTPLGGDRKDITAFHFANADGDVEKTPVGFVMQTIDAALMHAKDDAKEFDHVPATPEWWREAAGLARACAERFEMLAEAHSHEQN